MKKILALLLTLVLAVGLFAGCSADDDGLATVKVSEVAHSVFYAPQYAAMSQGFFEEEGLFVELINGGGADE